MRFRALNFHQFKTFSLILNILSKESFFKVSKLIAFSLLLSTFSCTFEQTAQVSIDLKIHSPSLLKTDGTFSSLYTKAFANIKLMNSSGKLIKNDEIEIKSGYNDVILDLKVDFSGELYLEVDYAVFANERKVNLLRWESE